MLTKCTKKKCQSSCTHYNNCLWFIWQHTKHHFGLQHAVYWDLTLCILIRLLLFNEISSNYLITFLLPVVAWIRPLTVSVKGPRLSQGWSVSPGQVEAPSTMRAGEDSLTAPSKVFDQLNLLVDTFGAILHINDQDVNICHAQKWIHFCLCISPTFCLQCIQSDCLEGKVEEENPSSRTCSRSLMRSSVCFYQNSERNRSLFLDTGSSG